MKKIIAAGALTLALTAAAALPAQAATTPVLFKAASGNQQGLATDGHYTWITYDAGNGKSIIRTYHWNGGLIGTSPALALGHGAELDYRVKDKHLYVANGGLETETTAKTKVFQVALSSKHVATKITKTYDFTSLGQNGMVAVDNTHDKMLVMGGPDAGPWKIVTAGFDGKITTTISVAPTDVLLQGLGVKGGNILLYVSDKAAGGARLDKYTASGTLVSQTALPFTGEAEGLAVNPITGSLYVGAHTPNRVMRLTGV